MKDKIPEACDFCNAEAGKPRPLGQYTVELTTIESSDGTVRKACQSCIVHHRKKPNGNEKLVQKAINKLKKLL